MTRWAGASLAPAAVMCSVYWIGVKVWFLTSRLIFGPAPQDSTGIPPHMAWVMFVVLPIISAFASGATFARAARTRSIWAALGVAVGLTAAVIAVPLEGRLNRFLALACAGISIAAFLGCQCVQRKADIRGHQD
jgi:hypothetical protein